MLYLYAAAFTVDISIVGRVLLSEVMSVLLLPWIIAYYRKHRLCRLEWQLVFGVVVWGIAAIGSDIYNASQFEDWSRGISKIAFFTINVFAIGFLCRRNKDNVLRLILCIAIASAFRLALGFIYDDTSLAGGWKFGYGTAFTLLAFSCGGKLATTRGIGFLGRIMPIGASAINLVFNARSLFGISFVAAVGQLLLINRRSKITTANVILIAIFGLVAIGAVSSTYRFAVESGALGSDALEKHQMQTSGSLGLLLGGRKESLASSQAIMDAPFLGHGSWARDIKYMELLVTELERAGVEVNGNPLEVDLIPSHSHILGAWVEHGLAGALFWMWALWITAKGLMEALKYPDYSLGVCLFIGLSLMWDLMFSPFGLERRVVTALWLYLMLLLANNESGWVRVRR